MPFSTIRPKSHVVPWKDSSWHSDQHISEVSSRKRVAIKSKLAFSSMNKAWVPSFVSELAKFGLLHSISCSEHISPTFNEPPESSPAASHLHRQTNQIIFGNKVSLDNQGNAITTDFILVVS